MRSKIVALAVALVLAAGAGWGIWYHSGAHCRQVLKSFKGESSIYQTSYNSHGWQNDDTQTDWRYLQAFVAQSPSCFSPDARAYMASHGN